MSETGLSFAERLAQSIRNHTPMPAFPELTSLEAGYDLQHKVTRARTRSKPIGGIKAGVTSPAIQSLFGLDHALIGALYEDRRLSSGCQLTHIPGQMIEVEAAVIVDETGNPTALAPAIEFVHLSFDVPTDMTVANLVACNLGADAYLIGDLKPWSQNLNASAVTLKRDGVIINQTRLSEALNGPVSGVKWMQEEALKRGLMTSQTNHKQIYLIGACGDVVPAEPGAYTADFDGLGQISFEIVTEG